jgi:hypothetical protein
MSNGWSTRRLHRLIVTSSAYRQAARSDADAARIDPDNRLWWRWQPRRLEVEAIRDSLLAVSGELDRRIGGAPEADEVVSVRRTLYLLQKRQKAPAVQSLFDGPGPATESCPKRGVSLGPQQALYLLNNDFAVKRAAAFARRVKAAAGEDRSAQVAAAFRLALGRTPDAAERDAAERFFRTVTDGPALELFCQALLNVNEFVYLE